MVYVITLVPVAAEAGSNVPAVPSVMPVPVHVPPAALAVRLNAPALEQSGATEVIDGVTAGFTVMDCVEVATHGELPTVYVTEIAPERPDGSNMLPVTPVPLQVPPVVPVTIVFRSTGASSAQSVVGVHVAVALGTTVM